MINKNIEEFFKNDYVFRGKHARYVKSLTEVYGNSLTSYKLFNRNLDVYLLAPIIGFLNKRLSEVDTSTNDIRKIDIGQIISVIENIEYSYRLIMLKDKKYESNYEKRVEKAFKFINTPQGKKDLEYFNKYVLGGVEVLYEQIIEKGKTSEDYILNLFNFVDEFDSINNEERDFEDML